MEQTIRIPDVLYGRLSGEAQVRGMSVESFIEQLYEEWERRDSELKKRDEAVKRIVELRERLAAKYGEMPDSVELIREDREQR